MSKALPDRPLTNVQLLAPWVVAVDRQVDRLEAEMATEPVDYPARLAEAYLLLIALNDLVRAARLSDSNPTVAAALTRFESTAADLPLVRNVIEHSDEYALGEGREQADRRNRPATIDRFGVGVEKNGATTILGVADIPCDLSAWGAAGRSLASEVQAAIAL